MDTYSQWCCIFTLISLHTSMRSSMLRISVSVSHSPIIEKQLYSWEPRGNWFHNNLNKIISKGIRFNVSFSKLKIFGTKRYCVMVVSKSLKSLFQTRHTIINMRKFSPLRRSTFAKYIPWIIFLAITLTANNRGNSASLRNSSGLAIWNQTSIDKIPHSRSTDFIKNALLAKGTKISKSRNFLLLLLLFSHVVSIGFMRLFRTWSAHETFLGDIFMRSLIYVFKI